MMGATPFPSPLMGEGYAGLASQTPSRSWMGVRSRPNTTLRRALTPIQAALAPCGRKLRYPSPIEGEGESAWLESRARRGLRQAQPERDLPLLFTQTPLVLSLSKDAGATFEDQW